MYKFQLPKGYSNINLLAYLMLLLLNVLVYLCSLGTKYQYDDPKREWLQGGCMMVWEMPFWLVKCLLIGGPAAVRIKWQHHWQSQAPGSSVQTIPSTPSSNVHGQQLPVPHAHGVVQPTLPPAIHATNSASMPVPISTTSASIAGSGLQAQSGSGSGQPAAHNTSSP